MVQVICIGLTLVQSPEILQEAVRIPRRTPKIPDYRVHFHLQLLLDLLVILLDEFSGCNKGRCPISREEEDFCVPCLWQPVSKIEEGLVKCRAIDT